MRASREQLKKIWSDNARAAALKARRGEAPDAPAAAGETAGQAADKANAYIAAHPSDFLPKGTKKPKAAKAAKAKGAGKAKDPKAEAAKAKEHAQREAEHAQRLKEHTADRARQQADREQKAKEHTASLAEHAKHEAEREADRQTRQKQQADRAKQQAAKAGKQSVGALKRVSSQAAGKQATGGSKRGSGGGKQPARGPVRGAPAPSGDIMGGMGAIGQQAAHAKKMAKVQSAIADILEQTGLQKAESDYSPATRAKRKAYDKSRPNAHPGKIAQRQAVRASIARGDRAPATTRKCAYCGKQADQYHHTNYTQKSGNVKPICAACNTRLSHQDDARKLAKRARARAWEAEMLSKAELPDLASNARQSLKKYS